MHDEEVISTVEAIISVAIMFACTVSGFITAIRWIRHFRTKRLVIAAPRGGTAISAAKSALEYEGMRVGVRQGAQPKKITLNGGTPSPPRGPGGSVSWLAQHSADWLQTDGGVQLTANVADSVRMTYTPARSQHVQASRGSRRMLMDIGGRLMDVVNSSHRVRSNARGLLQWDSPPQRASGRQATPSPPNGYQLLA